MSRVIMVDRNWSESEMIWNKLGFKQEECPGSNEKKCFLENELAWLDFRCVFSQSMTIMDLRGSVIDLACIYIERMLVF